MESGVRASGCTPWWGSLYRRDVMINDIRELTVAELGEIVGGVQQGIIIGIGSINIDSDVATQINIHRPHEGERNWHAHILLTTRRLEGERLSPRKARDLDPMIRRGKFGKPLKAANERSRDALVVYAHLQETQQRFDGRALD